jgi:hypothetical protein
MALRRLPDVLFTIQRFEPAGWVIDGGPGGAARSTVFGRGFRLERSRNPQGGFVSDLLIA